MFVLVLTFSVAFHPSLAQQNPASLETLGQPSHVRFSIQGVLELPEGSLSPLPSSIIEQLEQQPALRSMRFSGTDALSHDASSTLELRFVFAAMQAFREWYEDEQTQSLLGEL